MTTLNDAGRFQSGYTFPPELQGRETGTYPFAKVGDISRAGRTNSEQLVHADHYVDEADLVLLRARPIPAGSIAFAKIGEAMRQNHRVTLGVPMLIDNNAIAFVPDALKIDGRYAFHFLRQLDVYALADKTTVPAVRKSRLEEVPIALPPLSEQRRIASILDRANALCRKHQQTLELTDAFLRAAFLELFGDPATNPKGWPLVKVEEVLSKTRAGTRCGPFGSALKRDEYTDEGIPVWGIDNVLPNEFRESGSLFIDDTKYRELQSYNVVKGDVLISRAGTVGRMCVAQPTSERSIIGTNLIRVSLDQGLIAPGVFTAFFMWFSNRLGQLRANGKADAYSFMKTGVLREVSLPLPNMESQRKYLEVLETIRRKNAVLGEQQRLTATLVSSLQNEFFRQGSDLVALGDIHR